MNKKAFTLIELLAVIVIVAIIATIGFFSITKIMNNSKVKTLTDTALAAKRAANLYIASNELTTPEKFIDMSPDDGELKELLDVTKDPWGETYDSIQVEARKISATEHVTNVYLTAKTGCYVLMYNSDTIEKNPDCHIGTRIYMNAEHDVIPPSYAKGMLKFNNVAKTFTDIDGFVDGVSYPTASIKIDNNTFMSLGYGEIIKYDLYGNVISRGINNKVLPGWLFPVRVAKGTEHFYFQNDQGTYSIAKYSDIGGTTINNMVPITISPSENQPAFDADDNFYDWATAAGTLQIWKYKATDNYAEGLKELIVSTDNYYDGVELGLSIVSDGHLYLTDMYGNPNDTKGHLIDVNLSTNTVDFREITMTMVEGSWETVSISIDNTGTINVFKTDWGNYLTIDRYSKNFGYIGNIYKTTNQSSNANLWNWSGITF